MLGILRILQENGKLSDMDLTRCGCTDEMRWELVGRGYARAGTGPYWAITELGEDFLDIQENTNESSTGV